MRNRNQNVNPGTIEVDGRQIQFLNLSSSMFDGRYVRLSSSVSQHISSSLSVLNKIDIGSHRGNIFNAPLFVSGSGTMIVLQGDSNVLADSAVMRFVEVDDYRGAYIQYESLASGKLIFGVHNTQDMLSSSDAPSLAIHRTAGPSVSGAITMGTSMTPFSGAQVFITSSAHNILLMLKGPGTPVGIGQNHAGGSNTLEFFTADTAGFMSPRFIIRGGTDNADIEFYYGASGSLTQSMLFDGDTRNMVIGGDYSGSGGFKNTLGTWVRLNQAATVKNIMGQHDIGTVSFAAISYQVVMPYAGSIVGISAREANGAAAAGGTATFSASINGVDNATAVLTISSATNFGSTTFAKDTITFAAGDRLGITIASNTLPVATYDYNAWLIVEF